MRNLTVPHITERLESDLASHGHAVSARWGVDAYGKERSLSQVRLEYRPVLVGVDHDGYEAEVPLGEVTSIDVDKKVYIGDFKPEIHVLSSWRRAEWGDLVRFRPE